MRGRSCIAFHRHFFGDPSMPRRIALNIFCEPDFPIRIEMRTAFAAHPGSESFVEPEVVPPCHRHQIAEPLMRCFVGDNFVNALPRRGRRFLRVEQQRRFVIGDAAPILHRSTETTGNRNLIELGQRP